MDDFETDLHGIDFLPGVDLYLWVRLLLAVLAVVALGAVAVLVI